jgi:hypothetical protein
LRKRAEGVKAGELVQSPADLMKAATARPQREIFWYDVPERVSKMTGIQKVGVVELTSKEEMMAARRSEQDPIRLAFELAKESVRFLNDDPVNTGDGTTDTFWGTPGRGKAALRQLIIAAYGQIHNPGNEDIAAFLASQRMVVG